MLDSTFYNIDNSFSFKISELKNNCDHHEIINYKISPFSNLFYSSASGKRELTRKGYNFNIVIDMYFFQESDFFKNVLKLNEAYVILKMSESENSKVKLNCKVETFKHGNKSFYNKLRLSLYSVKPVHIVENLETLTANPVIINEEKRQYSIQVNDGQDSYTLEY